ncbi:ribonuclease H-like domain-containing protein, partial [Tanacetum coccineum]
MLMYSTLPMKPLLFTTEEKTQKKNDVKARSMLLMELPNEYLLTFNQYKDAKTLFAAIQTRFGGNDATKKTQKTLLKQMYENFNAPSTESLDSIFNRLQKIVSQLAILDLDSMSFDDLYNNFKIVEQEVKRTATSSTSSSSQNMAFVSSPSSINKVNTANVQVSTANSSVNLEQIHEDDLEEMDLKWQLALLKYESKKVLPKNWEEDHYQWKECKSPRNQESRPRNHDNGNRNQDSSRRTMNLEETSSKVMVAIDGAGFDWSFMAEEEVTTTMALMAFSNSEIYNDKTCSNTCLKSFKALKTQLDNLRPEFKGYGPKASKSVCVDTSNEVKKTPDTLLVEELVSEKEKQTIFPTKIEFATCPISHTLKHLMEDMLHLGEEPKEEELLVNELLKMNIVLFTDTGCFVPSHDFKLADERQVLLKVPRKNNMYSADMKNIVPKESLTCLVAKATLDELMLWHRRLGHVNFKTIKKLVKDNLVRGLPSKRFENDQIYVSCLKGKQHKAS